MKTTVTKKNEIKRDWHLIDAKGLSLGRLSAGIAKLLIGKDKAVYTPNMVSGDKVVVINSDKVKLTGNKLQDKMYYRHSGYAGGFKEHNAAYHMAKNSTFVIEKAVYGMLPKNRLRDRMMTNLYIYKDSKHPHEAQIKA
jgi:large subunit ribosomal protein L13